MALTFGQYDTEKFNDGVWCEREVERKSGKIELEHLKIARLGNPQYRDTLRKLERQYRKQHGEKLSAAEEDEMHAEAMAIGVLKDWRGVMAHDEGGNIVEAPYSAEHGKTYLLSDPSLVAFVASRATDLANFERADVEEQAKKPSPPSPTS